MSEGVIALLSAVQPSESPPQAAPPGHSALAGNVAFSRDDSVENSVSHRGRALSCQAASGWRVEMEPSKARGSAGVTASGSAAVADDPPRDFPRRQHRRGLADTTRHLSGLHLSGANEIVIVDARRNAAWTTRVARTVGSRLPVAPCAVHPPRPSRADPTTRDRCRRRFVRARPRCRPTWPRCGVRVGTTV